MSDTYRPTDRHRQADKSMHKQTDEQRKTDIECLGRHVLIKVHNSIIRLLYILCLLSLNTFYHRDYMPTDYLNKFTCFYKPYKIHVYTATNQKLPLYDAFILRNNVYSLCAYIEYLHLIKAFRC